MVELIHLNVCGKKFTVTRSTLEKSTYFQKLLKNPQPEYYIGRTGSLFKHVLGLLINPSYPYPKEHLDELIFYEMEYVAPVKVSDKKSYIASCGFGGKSIFIYDMNGNIHKELDVIDGDVRSIAVSADNKKIISGGTQAIIWNIESGQKLHVMQYHKRDITAVAFSKDNRWIATGCMGGILRIHDANTAVELFSTKAHDNWIRSLVFSHDNKRLISGSDDRSIKIWNLEQHICINTLDGHSYYVMSTAISPNDKTIVSGSYDGTVKIWSGENFEDVNTIYGKDVRAVTFSNDGELIAVGNDTTIAVYNSITLNLVCNLEGHTKNIRSLRFAPDDKTLISGAEDKSIKIWDLKNKCCKMSITTDYEVRNIELLQQ